MSRREFLQLATMAGVVLGAGAGLGGLLAGCGSGSTSASASAAATGAAGSAAGPFGGSGERNQIVVISDLHMGADLAYAEFNRNKKLLLDFLGQVRDSATVKELVIGGDLVDEWVVPATADTFAGKDQADFVKRVAAANRESFDLLNGIIQDGKTKVTYVPGNHDLTVTARDLENVLPGINQARDVQGLGTYVPDGHPEIAIEHGHRYNFFCAPDPISNKAVAPGSILPPGYFYTRLATLSAVERCTKPGTVFPKLTPDTAGGDAQAVAYAYWSIWDTILSASPIKEKNDEKVIVTGVDGFTGKYAIDDILPYQKTPGGPIDVDLYKESLTTWDRRQALNRVAMPIPTLQAVMGSVQNAAIDAQAANQYFTNLASSARIVVFGHTHAAILETSQNHEGQKSIYANSGTWIDSNPKYTTTNFVVITPQGADAASQTQVQLFNFENEVMTLMAEDSTRV